MELKRKKILYIITKSNWGGAVSETLGFPTSLARLGTAFRVGETPVSPTPFCAPPRTISYDHGAET